MTESTGHTQVVNLAALHPRLGPQVANLTRRRLRGGGNCTRNSSWPGPPRSGRNAKRVRICSSGLPARPSAGEAGEAGQKLKNVILAEPPPERGDENWAPAQVIRPDHRPDAKRAKREVRPNRVVEPAGADQRR